MDTLEIYLVRHGIAADSSPDGSDERRPLTEEGITELRQAAAALERLKVRLGLILSSPLVRARQTAEVLAAAGGSQPPHLVITPALAPSGSAAAVAVELRKHADKSIGRIAVVGHEPGMGELAALWIGATASVPFKKGAICRIDFDLPFRGKTEALTALGSLRWFATPKMLRAIGGTHR